MLFKRIWKILKYIIIIGFCGLILLILIPPVHHDVNIYLNDQFEKYEAYGGLAAKKYMPNKEDLGDYKSIDFHYMKGGYTISLRYADGSCGLTVEYELSTFNSAKENVFNKYQFLQEDQYDEHGHLTSLKQTEIGKWNFYIIDGPESSYPKSFGNVAINETKHSISYNYIYYSSLDFVENAKDFNSLLKNNLPWLFR